MYAWIWRKLPYGLPGKLTGSALLVTAMVALLWYVIFPLADPILPPYDDVQVTQESGVPEAPGPTSDEPPGDGYELHYDTTRNNTPPPSPSR